MANNAPLKQRCRAHNNSGKPCGNWAIYGGTVCRVHGGMAPQVKRKALERITEIRDVAAEKLLAQLQNDEVPPAVTMATVRDLTKTAADLVDREASAAATSVVDDWLDSLRSGK